VVVDVAIAVAIVAKIATAAEHRAGSSRYCAYRAADHRSDWPADRSPGGDASDRSDQEESSKAGLREDDVPALRLSRSVRFMGADRER
jgi:hypothetical protein